MPVDFLYLHIAILFVGGLSLTGAKVVEDVKESIEAVVANERKMTTFKIFLVRYQCHILIHVALLALSFPNVDFAKLCALRRGGLAVWYIVCLRSYRMQ